MRIGIVIAVAKELESFLNSDYHVDVLVDNVRGVFRTIIGDKEVYAIKSGAGQIDAASATQLLITKYDVDVILNFGVAGAIVKGLQVQDLFVVNKACNYDFDTSEVDDIGKHQYEEFEDMYIPLDEGLINLTRSLYPEIKDAYVASGDKFIGYKEEKDDLSNETLCNICDMEIAAIARTCFLNKIKCLSIKCISDTYEGSGTEYFENVSRSSDKAFKLMVEIIKELR